MGDSFPSPSRSFAAIHLSRKRARKDYVLLARLRERWHRVSDDGEGP